MDHVKALNVSDFFRFIALPLAVIVLGVGWALGSLVNSILPNA